MCLEQKEIEQIVWQVMQREEISFHHQVVCNREEGEGQHRSTNGSSSQVNELDTTLIVRQWGLCWTRSLKAFAALVFLAGHSHLSFSWLQPSHRILFFLAKIASIFHFLLIRKILQSCGCQQQIQGHCMSPCDCSHHNYQVPLMPSCSASQHLSCPGCRPQLGQQCPAYRRGGALCAPCSSAACQVKVEWSAHCPLP